MRAYGLGDIKQTVFPDGQVHVKVSPCKDLVILQARIRNGNELISVLLANEAFRNAGAKEVKLNISYLTGARMDRRMSETEPFSLKVIAECLKGKFAHIRVLDPHSDVTCALLDASPISSTDYVREAIRHLGWKPGNTVALCAPDAGAAKRVEQIATALGGYEVVQCLKHRDMATGKLSGFKVINDHALPPRVLIVDDICDGGRTFMSIAAKLKEDGVKWVGLYITHGIFSNGFKLENIDQIFTTTSYRPREEYPESVVVLGEDLA